MAFLTARKPSLTASLICVRVCLLGPFTSRVTERGFPHFSMNVYFSSPCKQDWTWLTTLPQHRQTGNKSKNRPRWTLTSVCSKTSPAYPKHSGVRSSIEFMAMPPQARVSLQREKHTVCITHCFDGVYDDKTFCSCGQHVFMQVNQSGSFTEF